jgi:hypothetical protein
VPSKGADAFEGIALLDPVVAAFESLDKSGPTLDEGETRAAAVKLFVMRI